MRTARIPKTADANSTANVSSYINPCHIFITVTVRGATVYAGEDVVKKENVVGVLHP